MLSNASVRQFLFKRLVVARHFLNGIPEFSVQRRKKTFQPWSDIRPPIHFLQQLDPVRGVTSCDFFCAQGQQPMFFFHLGDGCVGGIHVQQVAHQCDQIHRVSLLSQQCERPRLIKIEVRFRKVEVRIPFSMRGGRVGACLPVNQGLSVVAHVMDDEFKFLIQPAQQPFR